MATDLPAALTSVIQLRGFAWANEVEPQAEGSIPVLNDIGATVGRVSAEHEQADPFSLFDEIAPLSPEQRTTTLQLLEQVELDVLTHTLSQLSDHALAWLRAHMGDDSEDDLAPLLAQSPESLVSIPRKKRSEAIRMLGRGVDERIEGLIDLVQLRVGLEDIQALRDEVFCDSIRFAISEIRKWRGSLDFNMALLAACAGLETAIDRFDSSRGFRFSTYAQWWIRHSIGRQRQDRAFALRLPVHAHESLQRFRRMERQIWADGHARPDPNAVIAALGPSGPQAARQLEHLRPPRPADVQDIHGGLSLAEGILDSSLPSPWNGGPPAAWISSALRELEYAVEHTAKAPEDNQRNADILRRRLAIALPSDVALREIGETHGISRERIRQLQESAVTRLRIENFYTSDEPRPWRWRSGHE